ncbi:MAG: PIN domain-containing protein [Candidatus Korarchaeota archaeon]|nr:PIN domain-containing protein [Candidatus Korarchaeota archaeon]
MVIVLDTRFIIAHTFPPTKEDRDAILRFLRKHGGENFLVPTIVVSEFMKIAGRRIGEETAKVRIRAWLSSSRVSAFDLDKEIAEMAGELALEHHVPIADAIIASVAKKVGGIVATDDEHFRKLGVRVTWYKR